MSQEVEVIIADDHPVILVGIEQVLLNQKNVRLVAKAKNSTELIRLLKTNQSDVVVTDLVMPGGVYGDGLSLIDYVTRHFPDVKIVVMTVIENALLLKQLSRMRVMGIVSKSDDLSHIGLAVDRAMQGAFYVSPTIDQMLDMHRIEFHHNRQPKLSKREIEVLRLFIAGQSITEISTSVNRSIKTISTQKNTAMRKLGIKHDAELFQYAQSNGLLHLGKELMDVTDQPIVAEAKRIDSLLNQLGE